MSVMSRVQMMSVLVGMTVCWASWCGAAEPDHPTVAELKGSATDAFTADAKVHEAVHVAEHDGFQLLSVEVLPLQLTFNKEGAAGDFLVTEWLSKPFPGYSRWWESRFVTATVGIGFGHDGVTLLAPDGVRKALRIKD